MTGKAPTYSPALGAWLRKLSIALGLIGPRSAPRLWPCASHFRCALESGHVATPQELTLCAKGRHRISVKMRSDELRYCRCQTMLIVRVRSRQPQF